MEFKDIAVQYYRLRRHFHISYKDGDALSYLDLSHSLRIWVEMKSDIDGLLENKSPSIRFKNPERSTRTENILIGSKYLFLPLASGVNSAALPSKEVPVIDRALSVEEIKNFYGAIPTSITMSGLSFSEWLSSGIYKVVDPELADLELSLSREILIKRAASILGACLPHDSDNEEAQEHRFDQYVADLHKIKLAGGYPATYYQLADFAKDILDTVKTVFLVTNSE
jgi:hypothetical protein